MFLTTTSIFGNQNEPFLNFMKDNQIDNFDPFENEQDDHIDLYGRNLGHKFDGKLDSKNYRVRARRDKNGECKKYKESLYQHFYRIGNLFRYKGPNRNTKFKIQVTDFTVPTAIDIYGLGM